jgi:hypothetical protein
MAGALAAADRWTQLQLLPSEQLEFVTRTLDVLAGSAAGHGVATVGELAPRATSLIAELSGVHSLIVNHPPDVVDLIHEYRNVLAALVATSAWSAGSTPADAIRLLPTLTRRTLLKPGRPIYDDERLLLRLLASYQASRGGRRLIGAVRYVFADAGAAVKEATVITLDDLDDLNDPRQFHAPGYRDRDPRPIPLDNWGASIVILVVSYCLHTPKARGRLGYTGDKVGGSPPASTSAQKSVNRLLDKAGLLNHKDITAASVTFAAADLVAQQGGDNAAQALLGRRDRTGLDRDLRRVGTKPSPQPSTITTFLDSRFTPYNGPTAPAATPPRGTPRQRQPGGRHALAGWSLRRLAP